MSKYYKRRKKSNKGLVSGLIVGGVALLLVGAVGGLSKGFREWNWFDKQEEVIDTRSNLAVTDLRNKESDKKVTNTTLVTILNEGLGKDSKSIFKDVACVEKEEEKEYLLGNVYQDNGGLKFGTDSENGYFTVNLVENFKFNHAKIIGRNYSQLDETSKKYSCDESFISLNGAEKQAFGTNEEDTSKVAPTEEKEFEFDEFQDKLTISVTGERATIFEIQLWTDLVEEVE